MSDEFDELERRLAGLRPPAAPDELKLRIGRRMSRLRRIRLTLYFTAAALTAAAMVLVAVALFNVPVPAPSNGRQIASTMILRETPGPTAWSYRRAADQSPESLERLLDEQARRRGPFGDPISAMNIFKGNPP